MRSKTAKSSVRLAANEAFLRDVLQGLARPKKHLPCKYFYDDAGSRLFDKICETDEYYVTRTEVAITQSCAGEAARQMGPRCLLIEPGSGSGVKTRILLNHVDDLAGYAPIDIACGHLRRAAARLAKEFPDIEILPLCADFMARFTPPKPKITPERRVVYYPGSTIGNLAPSAAEKFMARLARICRRGGGLLIGVDLVKSPEILKRAYNDAKGVTAAFNLNLLQRINRELDADFDLEAFEHRAIYDERRQRIEMHLVSGASQVVNIDGESIEFQNGEVIHTEYSYKYTLEQFRSLAVRAGWTPQAVWTDDRQWFSVHWLTVE